MHERTTVKVNDSSMVIHWARPDKEEAARSRPGILVFQEAFGVNGHMLRVCHRLAEAGYVAAAPELFHREGSGVTFGYDEFDKVKPVMAKLTNASLLADAKATYESLSRDEGVDSTRIFAIGFCLGGFVTTLSAVNLPLKAAAAFYGGGIVKARPGMGITPLIGEFDRLRCPTFFAFGEKDQSIPPEDVAAIRARLEELRKPHRVEVYPGAGHGFCCDERPSYNPKAANEAWDQALAWLK